MASSPDAPFMATIVRATLLVLLGTTAARGDSSFFTSRIEPVFRQHCVACHGEEKDKGDLRLDSYDRLMAGGESGHVIVPGDPSGSELFWRVTLPADHEYVMPSDGKPLLTPDEIKLLELWIAGGASLTALESEFPEAPAVKRPPTYLPLAPDWQPLATEIKRLERDLGLKLVPRSQNVRDGLILRTASAPRRCDDATLAALAPVAELIVEAELARTAITDAGMSTLARFENLRALDLSRTQVTSSGLAALAPLQALEILNLTATAVDDAGVAHVKTLPALQRLWLFGTQATLGPSEEETATDASEAGAPSGT